MDNENTLSSFLHASESLPHFPESTTQAIENIGADQMIVDESTLFRDLVSDPSLRELANQEKYTEPSSVVSDKPNFREKPEMKVLPAVVKPLKDCTLANNNGNSQAKEQIQRKSGDRTPQKLSNQGKKTQALTSSSSSSSNNGSPPHPTKKTQVSRTKGTKDSTLSSSKNLSTPPSSTSSKNNMNSKKKTFRAALSAFLHLHHPCVTLAEQATLISKYEGREIELWEKLSRIFGPGSVPQRFLQPGESTRGSIRIQLTPKLSRSEGKETIKVMKEKDLSFETKETVSRTTTVAELVQSLLFRWEIIDDCFKQKKWSLCLFTVDSDIILDKSVIVRDAVVDGCIEYAWCEVPEERNHLLEDDSSSVWGIEHSLSAFCEPSPIKKRRRIQPIQVLTGTDELKQHS